MNDSRRADQRADHLPAPFVPRHHARRRAHAHRHRGVDGGMTLDPGFTDAGRGGGPESSRPAHPAAASPNMA